MLSLVLRRARGQYRLVASVVALVTVAATLLGVCALLLGPTQDRAFTQELQPSRAQDVDIDAFMVTLRNDELVEVRDTVADQLRDVFGSLEPEFTSIETSPVRELLGRRSAVGYLSAGDGIAPRSVLVSGRWPQGTTGTPETTVHEAAARRLGLEVGDEVRLDGGSGTGGIYEPVTLVVVGTFRPASDLGWESDLLVGAGVDPDYSDSANTEAAYGPFVIDDQAFLDSGSPVARLRVTARPDIARADRASLTDAVEAYDGAGDRLAADLADRVKLTRVTSQLPQTLDRIEAQRAAGRSSVLVAVLLGAALSLAALLLAGRLVASVRDEERVLLVAFGASPRQQLVAAAGEAVLLAVLAAALALPLAAVAHSGLTHLAGPDAAGLAQGPTFTRGLLLAVLGCTLLLAPALVLTALDTSTTSAATRRRWALARSGADATLLVVASAVAVLAWWQLRSQPDTAAARGDVTLTLAPVVGVAAATLVVVRLVPVLLRAASGLALRSPALVLPLSVQQAARRPHPGTALVLIAAAVAAATFGLGFRSTWERSQADQADLRVGTDLSLAVPTAPTEAEALAVRAAADGRSSAVSAVVARPVAIGRYVGTSDRPPVLVALDTHVAGDLLRGRLDERTWSDLADELDPGPAVTGPALLDGATLQGRSEASLPLRVTATAVVEGASGLRRTLTARKVALDGVAAPLTWDEPVADGDRLVALALHLDGPFPRSSDQVVDAGVTFTLALPGADEEGDWHAYPQADDPVSDPTVSVDPGPDGLALRVGAEVDNGRVGDGGGDLLVTSFAAPDGVPVALSEELADAIDAKTGQLLATVVGATSLPLKVVAVVPDVPSAPGGPAVLADADAISRGLLAGGQLGPLVDAWWVGEPTPAAEQALDDLGIGEVTTRAAATDDLARGPFEVIVPTVLTTLVVAAVVLLLAGIALVTGADRRRRAAELTRLRALGLPRADARRLLLTEHAAFLGPLVLLGFLVGAVASWLLGPLMVRSDSGSAPVPAAVADWPWVAAAVVVGGAVLGSALVTWAVAVRQVRASDHAGLRTGDS